MTMPSTASAVTTNSFSQKLEGKATMAPAVDFVDDGSADRALMFPWEASAEEGAKEQMLRPSVPMARKRRSGPMETLRGGLPVPQACAGLAGCGVRGHGRAL